MRMKRGRWLVRGGRRITLRVDLDWPLRRVRRPFRPDPSNWCCELRRGLGECGGGAVGLRCWCCCCCSGSWCVPWWCGGVSWCSISWPNLITLLISPVGLEDMLEDMIYVCGNGETLISIYISILVYAACLLPSPNDTFPSALQFMKLSTEDYSEIKSTHFC